MKKYLSWLPISYLIWVFLVFLINLPMPQDDLLRDVVAGNYNYDYTQLYIHAPFMAQYNQYIAFDYVLHGMALILGNTITVHLVQSLLFILFMWPVYILFNNILQNNEHKELILTLLLIFVFNNFTMLRLTLGRPEMFFTCWLAWGLMIKTLSKPKLVKIYWFACGLLMIPTYWLAFFYVPIVFFIFNDKREKVIYLSIYILLIVGFWQLYSHFQWLSSIGDLAMLNKNRLAVVGENKSIVIMLLSPITLIPLLFYAYTYKQQMIKLQYYLDWQKIRSQRISLQSIKTHFKDALFSNHLLTCVLFLLVPYLMLDMIRYSALISLLVGVILANRANSIDIRFTPFAKYLILCLAIFIPLSVDCYRTIPKFTLPEQSVVLGTNQSNYFVPFYSKNIQIAPAMEIGANVKDIQIMMKSVDVDGTVSCELLRQYHFTYVVEKNLTTVPKCLQIYQVQKGWRAWRVIYD